MELTEIHWKDVVKVEIKWSGSTVELSALEIRHMKHKEVGHAENVQWAAAKSVEGLYLSLVIELSVIAYDHIQRVMMCWRLDYYFKRKYIHSNNFIWDFFLCFWLKFQRCCCDERISSISTSL